jgi:hypothetical protein
MGAGASGGPLGERAAAKKPEIQKANKPRRVRRDRQLNSSQSQAKMDPTGGQPIQPIQRLKPLE